MIRSAVMLLLVAYGALFCAYVVVEVLHPEDFKKERKL